MNDFFTKLQKAAREVRLSPQEKQRLRAALYTAMEHAPGRAPGVVAAPGRRYYWRVSYRFAGALSLLFIVGVGAGTAYAAQGALPGSPLYGVKVNIEEPLRVALATTPQAKAQVNAQIAQERLEEAETLAEQGTLTATTSVQLAQNFDAHAQAAQAITNTLSTQDPVAAAQLSTEFDSALEAHATILQALSATSTSTTTREGWGILATHIRARERGEEAISLPLALTATSTPPGGIAVSTSVASSSSAAPTTESTPPAGVFSLNAKIATLLQTRAQTELENAQSLFTQLGSSLSTSTSAQVESDFSAIGAHMAAGAQALQSSDGASAVADFEAALRSSILLSDYLQVGNTPTSQNILPTLLNTVSGNEGRGTGQLQGNEGNGRGAPSRGRHHSFTNGSF